MAVSKRLRFEVFRRDNHTCRYCGATPPDVKLTIDHVTPTALGGTDTADNLVTACAPCNNGKTSSSPDAHHVAQVSDDALRWADAMKQAVDQLAAQEQVKLDYRNAFRAEWDRWGIGEGDDRRPVELPGDWKPSIENFRLASLPAWMWADIVDTAMGRDQVKPENKFKYCCGIAWNKVTELQEGARRIAGNKQQEAQQPDPETLDRAYFTHLLATWSWAWNRASDVPPTEDDIEDCGDEAYAFIERGLHKRIDLTEMAFLAGSDLCCDLSNYLPQEHMTPEQRQAQQPFTDEQFSLGADAINRWEAAWKDSSPKAGPTERDTKRFVAALSRALRNGHPPKHLLDAAEFAGAFLSVDLTEYLPKPRTNPLE